MVVFEVDFDTDPADAPVSWTDLSSRVVGTTEAVQGVGRNGRFDGSASVMLDNRDRVFDPTNTSSLYNLIPMRHARILNGSTPVFTGYVETWSPSWTTDGNATVQVRMVDASAWFALQTADVKLDAALSHVRVGTLLTLGGWPSDRRNIESGVVTLGPVPEKDRKLLNPNVAARQTQNLWSLLEEAVEAEQGRMWVGGDGTFYFRGRHDRFAATTVWTVGGPGGIPAVASAPAYDLLEVVNSSTVELADGVSESWQDTVSVTNYGVRDRPVRDLPFSSQEAQALAMWNVYRWAEPTIWLEQLTIKSRSTTEPIFDAQIGDLVEWTMPTSAGNHVTSGHIERIRHQIRPKDWQVSWDLSPYVGGGLWLEAAGTTGGPDEADLDGDNMLSP